MREKLPHAQLARDSLLPAISSSTLMAPTTRSRIAGESANAKKRVARYVDDTSSSEEIDDKGSYVRASAVASKNHDIDAPPALKKKPKKRAKVEKSVKSVAKKPAASGARTKKRGRLNALPEMPLDILEEASPNVCSYLMS